MMFPQRKRDKRRSRDGMASLEVVIATAIGLPAAAFLFFLGVRACRNLFHVAGHLIGWPYF